MILRNIQFEICYLLSLLSFPRSSVGMNTLTLQRRVTDRRSGRDRFPSWSVRNKK